MLSLQSLPFDRLMANGFRVQIRSLPKLNSHETRYRLAYNEELALRIRQALGEQDGVTERKMFGGLCFMAHGNMLGGVMGDDIIVRVGADRYEDTLKQPHTREMDFTGRPMRGFVVVASEGIASDEDLNEWVQRGVRFATSLPPK